jgi:Protein of unknown function (DUF2510)
VRAIRQPVRVSDSPTVPEKGWYPDPAGSARLRLWDGSRWTVHYSDLPPARPNPAEFSGPRRKLSRPSVSAWRIVFAVLWLLAIAAASIGALVDRPEFADVRASAWPALVVGGLPAVVVAIVVIRTRPILAVTAVGSGAWSVANSWTTMRDTHSTAALGIVATPILALVIVGVGCVADVAWRARKRTFGEP